MAPEMPFVCEPIEGVRIGFVGVGFMGTNHVRNLTQVPGAVIKAVCDIDTSHAERSKKIVADAGFPAPTLYTKGKHDFERMCAEEDLDLVFNATPWQWHVPISVTAMQNGKHAATEVPASVSLEGCWQLVETAEREQKHCVMMENCNYGQWEMMLLNMVRQGLLGEILHAECGYLHDLRPGKFGNEGEALWRREYSKTHNCNLYPTHGLGPVGQCLDINRGDRYDYLVSMSSPARGLQNWAREHYPHGHEVRSEKYALGDVNVSLIKTAQGRTIYLNHDTSLPRPYSRINIVQGTRGIFEGYPDRCHIEGGFEGTRVTYSGNNDQPFELADLNFDGAIDELDWPIYLAGYRQPLSTESQTLAYQMGDLDFDGDNDAADFRIFKTSYELANGPGSFAALAAKIPKPESWMLLVVSGCLLVTRGRAARLRVGRRTIVPSAAVMAVLIVGVVPAWAQLPQVVAHWPLDTDAVDVVGGHNGTVFGVDFGEPGANANTGMSALFNPTGASEQDGIDVPWAAALNPQSYTVTAWALSKTNTGFQSVVTSRESIGDGVFGYVLYDNSNGNWDHWTGPGADSLGWDTLADPASVNSDNWQHVAISYDATSGVKSLFVDGILVNTSAGGNYSANPSTPLHIGAGADTGLEFFFEGNIDDVGIFDGALSTPEILNVRDNGVSAYVPLRLKLRLDPVDGDAEIVNDSGIDFDIDLYEVLSEAGSLNESGLDSSLNEWDVLGIPDSSFVGEGFLQGSTNVGNTPIYLGNIFNTSMPQDVEFNYALPEGLLFQGIVEYGSVDPPEGFDGDFDGNGSVGNSDLTLLLDSWGKVPAAGWVNNVPAGTVGNDSLTILLDNWGNAALSTSNVPEPTALALLSLGCCSLALRRRK